jgi:meso-butanediol dehydrogenase / (S,S)-butanediol dehydrogenase / diacetyl reductase
LQRRFADKIVVISGAGSGIGAATAKRVASEGGIIVLIGRRKEKLESVIKALDASRTLGAPCDIANVDDVERVTQVILARFGKIDVLINNAGVGYPGGFLDLPLKYWNEMLDVNLNGVVHLTRFALPSLVDTHGAIVNVASIAACGGERGNSMYAAGKAAVNSLTKSLALEFGHVVRVNCVNPGLTKSELTEILFDPKSAYYSIGQKLVDVIPRKAPARPDEIANAIVFLASDEASFINGACVPVDGGVSASNGQGAFLDAQSR